MKFVIIGGDAAGMSAASRAKRHHPDMEVTVLEKTDDVSYSACGMPYNIADSERPIDDLVVRSAQTFREKQGINLLTGHEVQSIDRRNKTVSGLSADQQPFSINYDKLLIATGASPVIPDLPGMDLPGVFALKSLDDGRQIKAFLADHNVKKAVIVGMGYIALEMSEALRARGIAVEMIKPRARFLPTMNEALADIIQQELEKNEVKLNLGYPVEKIESLSESGSTGHLLKVVSSELELPCDMVIAAIGVKPNSGFAAEAGLELGPKKAIAVDSNMKTSDEDIYSAGDCADAYHVVTGNKTYIPLALRANRGGWVVADNVCGKNVSIPGIAGTAVFKVFDLQVARTGLTIDQAKENGFDAEGIYIKTRSRAHAHPGSTTIHLHMIGDRASGRLLGLEMVGKEGAAHRINAGAVALHAGMTVEQFSESDLAYAPPFSPVWDPMLTTANQLVKRLQKNG